MDDRQAAIGGEFQVGCQAFFANKPESASAWPEYSDMRCVRCDSGRSALLLALQHWQRQTGRRPDVWMPSYLCTSLPEIVKRIGLRMRSYEDGPGGVLPFVPPQPSENDLIVVVHYFGHANLRALEWLSVLPSRRWGVIEDCVQAPYSGGVGGAGEYVITSLRKWWPATDGATLHYRGDAWRPELLKPDEGFVSRRLLATMLRSLGTDAEARHLTLLAESEARLDESLVARHISWVSEILLGAADRDAMCQRRRRNWNRLATILPGIFGWGSVLQPLFPSLAADAIPLAFPLHVEEHRRDGLRSHLATHRIYCPIHWQLDASARGAVAEFARSTLSLPIDQRYEVEDMDLMAQSIANFFEGSDHE